MRYIKEFFSLIYIIIRSLVIAFAKLIWGFLIVVGTLTLIASCMGCASHAPPPPEKVFINTPTFCKVIFPLRPDITDADPHDYQAFLTNLRGFLVYTDELEMALKCCTNSHDCITKPAASLLTD